MKLLKNFKKDFFLISFFRDIALISSLIDRHQLLKLIKSIKKIKSNNGRIFFLGVGGSGGNCSHAVNDFRKLCSIECYTPTDNVSELTARINDDGWNSSFVNWLKISKLNKNDAIFIFSVGGGDLQKKISVNLIESIKHAKKVKASVFGIVGRKNCYTKKNGNNVIVIPNINRNNITPYCESFQAVVWHAIVSHPLLKSNKTKW